MPHPCPTRRSSDLSDDGLQHYRLARDLEICLIDGRRGLGNGALLPAGPLRETPARLAEVQWVVINGDGWTHAGALQLRLRPAPLRRLAADDQQTMATLSALRTIDTAQCRVRGVTYE